MPDRSVSTSENGAKAHFDGPLSVPPGEAFLRGIRRELASMVECLDARLAAGRMARGGRSPKAIPPHGDYGGPLVCLVAKYEDGTERMVDVPSSPVGTPAPAAVLRAVEAVKRYANNWSRGIAGGQPPFEPHPDGPWIRRSDVLAAVAAAFGGLAVADSREGGESDA